MSTAAPAATLRHLREALAGIDPSLTPRLSDRERRVGLGASIDAVLGGGLAFGLLHEFAPAAPMHLAAASGFALALAARAARTGGEVLWIATGFAMSEGGGPYGPGLDQFGLASARLLVLRVSRAVDVLWAMEEGLRCRALAGVVAELSGEGEAAGLTATRRLTLAARENAGLGLLVRHRALAAPCAAATRWTVAAAPSRPDAYGGLGRACFDVSLHKNRRGPSGRWFIEWDHHACAFQPAVPVAVAAAAFDRPDRTPLANVG
jgi:protein ImuA